MKNSRIFPLIFIFVMGLLLSACAGGMTVNGWPGASVDENGLFLAAGNQVYALNPDNGNLLWKFPEKASANQLFFAIPAVNTDVVIVGDYTSKLYALGIKDGKERWQFDDAKSRYIASPVIVGETLLAANADGKLYALDMNGSLKWSFETKHALWATPQVDGETVFLSSMDHSIYSLNLNDGSENWSEDLGSALVAPALYNDGIIYQGSLNGEFHALQAKDGKILWTYKADSGVWSEALLHEGKLYFGDQKGVIYILTASDGSLVQRITTESAITGKPALMKDGMVFSNEKGEVYTIGFGGERMWTRTVEGKAFSEITVTGDKIYVPYAQGKKLLEVFDINGNGLWSFTPSK